MRVDWKLGKDTNEWVWVMGEHSHDKAISQIIEEEAQDKAQSQAEQEAEEFRYTDRQTRHDMLICLTLDFSNKIMLMMY